MSSPPTNWDESPIPPGSIEVLLKASGTPIDQFSFESVELLRDIAARWQTMNKIRSSPAMAGNKDPEITKLLRAPNPQIYAIDVSFSQLKDAAELAYLNQQPTTFVLPPEAVDRLRAAAGTLILQSPEFQQVLKDLNATIVPTKPVVAAPAVR